MDGQAESAPVTTDDLAQAFLADTSQETDEEEEQQATDESPAQDTDESETEDDSPDDESEDDSEPESQTSGRKYKVTVKGEDGADIQQEVEEKELIAGYQRHADYTRKTQELARREEQAYDAVQNRITEVQNHFVQQTQLAHAAVQQLAGLRTPAEMAALAQSDPAAYVAEQARVNQIQGVLGNMQAQIAQTQAQARQQQQEHLQKEFSRCWGVIGQKGIDKPKLQHIFESVSRDYGVPTERFASLSDPALVLIMNDAVAYRELQKKKAEVTKKAANAPRLPQKQDVPRGEGQRKRLDAVFKSGRAGVKDLAAMFERM